MSVVFGIMTMYCVAIASVMYCTPAPRRRSTLAVILGTTTFGFACGTWLLWLLVRGGLTMSSTTAMLLYCSAFVGGGDCSSVDAVYSFEISYRRAQAMLDELRYVLGADAAPFIKRRALPSDSSGGPAPHPFNASFCTVISNDVEARRVVSMARNMSRYHVGDMFSVVDLRRRNASTFDIEREWERLRVSTDITLGLELLPTMPTGGYETLFTSVFQCIRKHAARRNADPNDRTVFVKIDPDVLILNRTRFETLMREIVYTCDTKGVLGRCYFGSLQFARHWNPIFFSGMFYGLVGLAFPVDKVLAKDLYYSTEDVFFAETLRLYSKPYSWHNVDDVINVNAVKYTYDGGQYILQHADQKKNVINDDRPAGSNRWPQQQA